MKVALAFTVAGAHLSLEIAHVREVLPAVRLVTPPEIPSILKGFVNLEGEMIPVLRLEHLLQLKADANWQPESDLGALIVVARFAGAHYAWWVQDDAKVFRYAFSEMVRLPVGHVLNNCAEWVIARKPPEPSIVLLDPERLLLETERRRIADLQKREAARLAEIMVVTEG